MVFRQSNRLNFIIITLIHFLIHCDERHVCNASVITDSDICEFVTGQQMYCYCDNSGVNEARQVTCSIVSTERLTPTDLVWNRFRFQQNITSLVFTTRVDTKLSFLPVRALRNFADSLETLNFNEMSLGVLESNSMSNFSKLSKITLESNEIRGLSESSFAHLPALKVISLSGNSIEILKANVFIDLPNLEELFLDRNQLTTIEDNAFIHLKHLREIDLRLNRINTIRASTFWGLSHLKRLDLSRNQLKVIPSFAFTGAPLLRDLDLNKNEIITIEDNAFHNMSHLMSLQLNENKIRYLSTALFKSSPQLVLIDLSNNNLETFEKELIDNLEHLQREQFVIYLKENQFECDCRLIWLTNMSRTVGQLFKRELKLIKCTVKREFADLAVGEQIKVLRLGHNESIINACRSKLTTQQVLIPENENRGQNLFPTIVNNISHSITNIDNYNNKIDEVNQEFLAVKTDFTESTESILHEISEVENSISIANDALKPSSSQKKSNKADGDSGGVFRIKYDTKIIISSLLIIFIFCKNQLIE